MGEMMGGSALFHNTPSVEGVLRSHRLIIPGCVCVSQYGSIYPIATARHQSQHHGWPLCTLLFTWISCRSQYGVKRNISSSERSCTQIHSSRWWDDGSTYVCVAYTFSFALALWKSQWYRVTVVSISPSRRRNSMTLLSPWFGSFHKLPVGGHCESASIASFKSF